MTIRILQGDCREVLRTLPAESVDSIVTDPPYGLGKEPDALAMLTDWLGSGHHDVRGSGFMGKAWDAFVPSPTLWRECLRVLKPGGHLLAFAGTRTHDLMTMGLRIAGFEIRDTIMWVYGSGFPKSLDVSKAIDKAAGHWRGKAGATVSENGAMSGANYTRTPKGDPVTAAAAAWQGWGTALKPALEPITVARKPLIGTVAANVLAHGTGGLNIDGCRIDGIKDVPASVRRAAQGSAYGDLSKANGDTGGFDPNVGRWPANLIHDGSEEVVALFPHTVGQIGGNNDPNGSLGYHGGAAGRSNPGIPDAGSAARFFYCAKASRADRNAGCAGMEKRAGGSLNMRADAHAETNGNIPAARTNNHPTVKPTTLMRYLVRLVTPPGGTVLDPFTGSGSTGRACALEGFAFIGCELSADYIAIANARIADAQREANEKREEAAAKHPDLFVVGANA